IEAVLYIACQVDIADPTNLDFSRIEVQPAAVTSFVDGLRIDDVEPQPVVQRQLRADPPSVLRVIEMTPLSLARIRVGAHESAEAGHIAQQESCQSEAA